MHHLCDRLSSGDIALTIIVAITIFFLVGGIIVSIVKRSFRMTAMFVVSAVLLLGIALFVIGTMK